jgi:hypothetical protein
LSSVEVRLDKQGDVESNGTVTTSSIPRYTDTTGVQIDESEWQINVSGDLISKATGTSNIYPKSGGGGNVGIASQAFANMAANQFTFVDAVSSFDTIVKPSASITGTYTLTLPTTAGTNGYVLSTDGTGVLSWISAGLSSSATTDNALLRWNTGVGDPIQETSWTIDDNGNATTTGNIVPDTDQADNLGTASNAFYQVATYQTVLKGINATAPNAEITIRPPNDNAAIYTLVLPTTDGNANEFLQTDGSGNLSWATSGGSFALNDLTDVTAPTATKGDMLVYNGSAWINLAVGVNGEVLTAASGAAAGVQWDSVPAPTTAWDIAGNALTADGTVGSNSGAFDVIFKGNGTEYMRFDTSATQMQFVQKAYFFNTLAAPYHKFETNGEVIFNAGNLGTATDFRVQGVSDNNTLRVDYGEDQVLIRAFSPTADSEIGLKMGKGLLFGMSTATTNGVVRWNTTTLDLECRKGGLWKSLTGSGGGTTAYAITAAGANTGGGNTKPLFFGINNANGPVVIPKACTLVEVGWSLNQAVASTGNRHARVEYSKNGGAFTELARVSDGEQWKNETVSVSFARGDRLELQSVASNMSPTSAEPTVILYFEVT